MRQRKEILLLMRNEDDNCCWRMRLELWGYSVTAADTLDEALAWLRRMPVEAIATSIPGSEGADALARYAPVLLFDVGADCPPGRALACEPRGPVLAQRVHEALKNVSARKRGPKHLSEQIVDVDAARIAEKLQ